MMMTTEATVKQTEDTFEVCTFVCIATYLIA